VRESNKHAKERINRSRMLEDKKKIGQGERGLHITQLVREKSRCADVSDGEGGTERLSTQRPTNARSKSPEKEKKGRSPVILKKGRFVVDKEKKSE